MLLFFAKNINSKIGKRLISTWYPEIDIEYYCDVKNLSEIKHNVEIRKGVGDINRIHELYAKFRTISSSDSMYKNIEDTFHSELLKLPNRTHPAVRDYNEDPRTVSTINVRKHFGSFKPFEFSEITQLFNLMRTDKLGYTCDSKSYYYFGELAEYEEALLKYTVSSLIKKGFALVSVPDILSSDIINSCGMAVNSDRTQVIDIAYEKFEAKYI